jgi:hypothetical protein
MNEFKARGYELMLETNSTSDIDFHLIFPLNDTLEVDGVFPEDYYHNDL